MSAANRTLAAMRVVAVAGGICTLAVWSATCTEYDSELLTYSHLADASAGDGDGSPDAIEASSDATPLDSGADGDSGTTACDPACSDPTLVRPPCPPDIPDPPSQATPLVFAMRTIRAGMSTAAPTDWKTIGLDLDCLFTKNGAPTGCKAASADVIEDGDQGRDNSFGNNLGGAIRFMEQLSVITTDVEVGWNEGLTAGTTGLLFEVENFGGGTDDPEVLVSVYMSQGVYDQSGTNEIVAKWDGNDYWVIDRDSVSPLNQPKYLDDAAYVTGNRVVGHLPPGLPLKFVAGSGMMELSLSNSVFVLEMSADHQHVLSGVLSGVWYTSEAVSALDSYAAQSGVCPDDPKYGVARDILAKASDIRIDLKPAPNLDCNGMSIGLAFTAEPAKLGAIRDPPTPNPSQCGDAGN